ncbi:MAG: hypothetical protein IT285_00245 [Bdellovibrionales bacterium]|nr:hypothetical protein [Bdellovibrionales bacterium]
MAERNPGKPGGEVEEFADLVGDFMEYWGFKHVHGRIWAHLYLSPEPLSAVMLSRKLGVSKALVSLAMADLARFDVIQEAGRGAKRTVLLKANPNLQAVIQNVLRAREMLLLERAWLSYEKLAAAPGAAPPERLRDLGELIENAVAALVAVTSQGDGPLGRR